MFKGGVKKDVTAGSHNIEKNENKIWFTWTIYL